MKRNFSQGQEECATSIDCAAEEDDEYFCKWHRGLGIGIVAYSPLGRGFFTGKDAADLTAGDFKKNIPRFHEENFRTNRRFYEQLCELGAKNELYTRFGFRI